MQNQSFLQKADDDDHGTFDYDWLVDETTQQILFDRLREHLLQRFMLVSHIIVDSIRRKDSKASISKTAEAANA